MHQCYNFHRSIVATATFFVSAVLTTQMFHRNIPAIGTADWSLTTSDTTLLALQLIPFSISALLYALVRDVPDKSIYA